jgi:hypothetical protein
LRTLVRDRHAWGRIWWNTLLEGGADDDGAPRGGITPPKTFDDHRDELRQYVLFRSGPLAARIDEMALEVKANYKR